MHGPCEANRSVRPTHARAALRQIGLSDRHREERRVLRWARAKKIETLSRETIRREIFSQRIDAERAQAIIDAPQALVTTTDPEEFSADFRERARVLQICEGKIL